MTRLLAIPLLAAILALSACVLSGKNAASKTPATPAPPPATAAAKPPSPPSPLSTPQTDIQLPPPQPVTAAALATIPAVREEVPVPEPDEPPAPPPAKSKPPAAASAPKPDTPAPAAETPSPVQGPPAPATTPSTEEQALQPVHSDEEKRRFSADLEKRKADIEMQLHNMNQKNMSADQKNEVDRIRSFISVAEDMARRGDLRSAEASLVRAVILTRELASGR